MNELDKSFWEHDGPSRYFLDGKEIDKNGKPLEDIKPTLVINGIECGPPYNDYSLMKADGTITGTNQSVTHGDPILTNVITGLAPEKKKMKFALATSDNIIQAYRSGFKKIAVFCVPPLATILRQGIRQKIYSALTHNSAYRLKLIGDTEIYFITKENQSHGLWVDCIISQGDHILSKALIENRNMIACYMKPVVPAITGEWVTDEYNTKYSHKTPCPHCGNPAYIGLNELDCSKGCK